jgi:DNA-binding Lrp family transcriptional regulator
MTIDAADLDDIDLRLLRLLLQDPRLSVAALAERVGLARSTAHNRVARLERLGLTTAVGPSVNPEILGYGVLAFVTVLVTQRRLEAVAEELAKVPEVLEVHVTTGGGDLHCRVVAKDNHHFFEVVEQLLTIPGLQRTTTQLAVKELVAYHVEPLIDAALEEASP